MPYGLARDIMIPLNEYGTVRKNDTLKNAIKIMKLSLTKGHRSVAVIDEGDNLVGFLTIRTILSALDALGYKDDIQDKSGMDIPPLGAWSGFFIKNRIKHASKIKVSEVMRSVRRVFINEDATAEQAAKLILKNQVNNIPVLNKEKKIVGMVRSYFERGCRCAQEFAVFYGINRYCAFFLRNVGRQFYLGVKFIAVNHYTIFLGGVEAIFTVNIHQSVNIAFCGPRGKSYQAFVGVFCHFGPGINRRKVIIKTQLFF
jgi:CBS domain-containing protein